MDRLIEAEEFYAKVSPTVIEKGQLYSVVRKRGKCKKAGGLKLVERRIKNTCRLHYKEVKDSEDITRFQDQNITLHQFQYKIARGPGQPIK